MKHKVGDKVRIKSREEVDRYLKENGDFESGWAWNEEMLED